MPIKAAGFCSPTRLEQKERTGTCLTIEELRSVAALYNKKNPNTPIPMAAFKNHSNLVRHLDRRFKRKCPSKADHCWIEQDEVRELYNSLEQNYRPQKPTEWQGKSKSRMWLNTFDILEVMKQYQDNEFKFLGVFPVDFNQTKNNQCIVKNMCSFNAQELIQQGYKHFGIVFNLDKHNEPGSHWVATYCNMDPSSKKFGVCYYDSGGIKPPKYIKEFIKDVRDQVVQHHKDKGSTFCTKYNNTRHQFLNTECGIFSMIFIILCKENTMETYRQSRAKIPKHPTDSKAFEFRGVLYRPYTKS